MASDATPNMVCFECLSVVKPAFEACPNCGRTRPTGGWKMDPLVGLVINNAYQIEERLGEGGMASVYKARRLGALGGHVAVKILAPTLSRTVVARRFEREAKVVSQLSNPQVVRVYGFDSFKYPVADQELYYIAMELVNGVPLSALLKQQKNVSFLWAIDVLRQAARGLDEAHDLGIVHRDLKPSNIMIIQQRRATHVKILDFGIAAITDQQGEQVEKLTRTGLVTGTPDYMAPEQAMGSDAVGSASDMYSLGVIAFQLFAGKLPFSGNTAMEVLTKRVTSPAPSLASACPPPALPPTIYQIVDRLLQRDAAKRYQNAGELLDDLSTFPTMHTTPDFVPDAKLLAEFNTLGGMTGVAQEAPAGPDGTWIAGAAPEPKPAKAGGGGKRWLWAALVVLILGGGGAAAAIMLTGDKTPDAKEQLAGADAGATRSSAADAGSAVAVPPATEEDAVSIAAAADTGPATAAVDAARAAAEREVTVATALPNTVAPDTAGAEAKAEVSVAKVADDATQIGDAVAVATADTAREAGPTANPTKERDLKAALGYARPPLEPTYEEATSAPALARDHAVAVPKKRPQLFEPLSLRFGVERDGTPLRLDKVNASMTLGVGGTSLGEVKGRVRPQDGRAVIDLPPRPAPGKYLITFDYELSGGARGSVVLQWDTAASTLAPGGGG